jgi:hypothetical protein
MNEGDIVEYVQMRVREISKSSDNGRWMEAAQWLVVLVLRILIQQVSVAIPYTVGDTRRDLEC